MSSVMTQLPDILDIPYKHGRNDPKHDRQHQSGQECFFSVADAAEKKGSPYLSDMTTLTFCFFWQWDEAGKKTPG